MAADSPPHSPVLTRRASLLTDGLASLRDKSPSITKLLVELYKLDDDLQEAHARAKEDDEFGEDVVVKYEEFLAHREVLISALELAAVPVPWQLYVRIDDIEFTLRQRKEKAGGASKSTGAAKGGAAAERPTERAEAADTPTVEAHSGSFAIWLLPALLALAIAVVWSQYQH